MFYYWIHNLPQFFIMYCYIVFFLIIEFLVDVGFVEMMNRCLKVVLPMKMSRSLMRKGSLYYQTVKQEQISIRFLKVADTLRLVLRSDKLIQVKAQNQTSFILKQTEICFEIYPNLQWISTMTSRRQPQPPHPAHQ